MLHNIKEIIDIFIDQLSLQLYIAFNILKGCAFKSSQNRKELFGNPANQTTVFEINANGLAIGTPVTAAL